jgi:hypothetical protein
MKKDTQTLLLVFLGTLLLAGGILFFFFYDPFEPSVAPPVPPVNDTLVEEDPMEEDTPPLTDYPQNPTAQKLKEAIEKLRNASWDKPTFENLEFEVKNAFKSKLIDQATYELFQKRLHLNYLVSLKREVDQVITNSTSLSDLAAPHRELKAQAQAGQRNKVANHLRKSSAVYGLYNLTKELRERIDSGELKEDALQSYAEKIEAYPKREMFNNSKLVKTLSDSGMEKLKQFWSQQVTSQLQAPISTYYTTSEYKKDSTQKYLDLLKKIKQNPYLSRNTRLSKLTNEQEIFLRKHKDIHTAYEASMELLSGSCEDEFKPFQYYIDKCKNDLDNENK